MSSTACAASDPRLVAPDWLRALLGLDGLPAEGQAVTAAGQDLVMQDGILRSQALVSAAQGQTREAFGFKWKKRDTFESPAALARMRAWLVERYGGVETYNWLAGAATPPLILDAGCGAAMSGIEYFGPVLEHIRYLGIDVSEAVEVARDRFAERGVTAGFLQADIVNLPLPAESVDVIFSEGVLHHTDSTRGALAGLVPLLKRGGRFMFYVYKTKGPIREFTDDLLRDKLQAMAPQDGWDALMPLTRLGKVLGDLDIEIEVPEAIDLLEIPAGRINLQRLFYWHVFKAFYRPDYSLDEMNHINFDWYSPRNAHRQTPEEVRGWCADFGLEIEREVVEDAGITVVARRV